VLRGVFGPKKDEVTGEWRKLHNEKLNDLFSLPNIVRVVKSRRMRWAGHVACIGENRIVHKVLVEKPEGKRPLGRPRRKWEDNIKMDLQEVGRGRGDWMELAQDRDRWQALGGYSEGLSGSINAGNFLTSLLVSFSRRTLLHGVKYQVVYCISVCDTCNNKELHYILYRWVLSSGQYWYIFLFFFFFSFQQLHC
jgi:hypothetical protein